MITTQIVPLSAGDDRSWAAVANRATPRMVDRMRCFPILPLLETNKIVEQQYHLRNVWGSREKNYYNIDKKGKMQ
jgi:hypothetical protein